MRFAPKDKATIAKAAKKSGHSMTEFLTIAALAKADSILGVIGNMK